MEKQKPPSDWWEGGFAIESAVTDAQKKFLMRSLDVLKEVLPASEYALLELGGFDNWVKRKTKYSISAIIALTKDEIERKRAKANRHCGRCGRRLEIDEVAICRHCNAVTLELKLR